MFYDGINLVYALVLAVVSGVVLLVSHYLLSKWEAVTVPTIQFWSKEYSQHKPDMLLGKLSSLNTLLFLLLIMLLLVISMLKPGFGEKVNNVIVIDTSVVTDLNEAGSIANTIISKSDSCTLFISGRDYAIVSNESDSPLIALSGIDDINQSASYYSSLSQAVNEAVRSAVADNVYVITGQEYLSEEDVNIISVPKKVDRISQDQISVWVPDEFNDIANVFFKADKRFIRSKDPKVANVIVSKELLGSLPDWRAPIFAEKFSGLLELHAGIDNRTIVKPNIASANTEIAITGKSSLESLFYGLCFIVLLANIIMFKKGIIQ